MKILAIETSCDETALSLIEASGDLAHPQFKIIKEAVISQIDMHREFGGVVPNIAKREHLKALPILLGKIFPAGKSRMEDVDCIAVTTGPGLEPALWTGITFAEALADKYKKPLLGANHLEGHLYSFLLSKKTPAENILPAVALIVSGGHTLLLQVKNLKSWKKLGETRDDAVGEAYDKVARILGLPYPGGPEIEKLALKGNPGAIPFPRPMLHQKNYDFSFSGLKTAVLYHVRNATIMKKLTPKEKADIAASFAAAAIEVIVKKTMRAAEATGAKSILLSGGVAANQALRKALATEGKKLGAPLLVSNRKHNTDNATMIAAAAYMNMLRGKKFSKKKLKAEGQLGI
jgi:N6-L-threonylcarbamoyladenine synthase